MASRKPKVVVVGAGFAGLGAARALLSDPKFDVTILEGTSKVGGRAKSVSFQGGYTAELGCTFLYYIENMVTAVADFVREKGFVVRMQGSYDELSDTGVPAVRLLSNGEELPHDAVKHYQEIYFKIQEELAERARRDNWSYVIDPKWGKDKEVMNPREVEYEVYMERRFEAATKTDPVQPAKSALWRPKHVMEHLHMYESFMNATKRSVGVELVPQYTSWVEPVDQFILNCSYQDVVDSLAQDVPTASLLLNKEVECIQWTPPPPSHSKADTKSQSESSSSVMVCCTDGTSYPADHVIVTVSLGVLQQKCRPASSTPFFRPKLPEEKLSSIMKLGMGKGCKILLEFPRPLLDRSHRSIELYWLEGDYEYPEKYPWARRQYILQRIQDSSIYAAYISGEDAAAVENATDEEITEAFCLILGKFLQKPAERPVRIEKSSWCKDKFFLGSYSYNATGSDNCNREILAQPVSGSTPLQLLFAGEASHHSGAWSTTIGAYETGIREAKRLLELYAHH